MKIKVLETIRQGLIGGGETHLLSLVEHMDKNIFEPSVLSFTDGPMVERAKAMGLQTHVIHTERPFDVLAWRRVKQLIRNWKVDIVHAHGTRAASNVLWPAKYLGLPVIYTVHGWSFHNDQRPIVKKVRIISEKYLTDRADINISVSVSNQQTGKSYFSGFESIVIPNGIDESKFNPHRVYKNIRQEIGIPGNATLIVFVARFTNHKQPLKVIEGFYSAQQKMQGLKLLMVGDGDAKPAALELVKNLGIENDVYFQGFRSDVPDVLAAADIFALPSLWEGMAISLLEAMSMGKVVVASDVDGNSEVVRHLENGWLVGLDNIEENLANAFVTISKDDNLRKKLQEGAISTIHNRYSAAKMTKQTEEVYLKLYHEKERSRRHEYLYGI